MFAGRLAGTPPELEAVPSTELEAVPSTDAKLVGTDDIEGVKVCTNAGTDKGASLDELVSSRLDRLSQLTRLG